MKIKDYKSNFRTMVMALALTCGVCDAMPLSAAEASVVTNKVWLSGATHIFGRMTVTGIASGNITTQGFCYSTTNKVPTVDDQVSNVFLSNQGRIYTLSGLTPSTVYYIRAYVKKGNGDIVYGDPVKAITRPQGGVSYGIRDGFPADALARIQSAAKQAVDLWNEYTGIRGLYVNIGYGASTPTADCSYGGWMRVGPNSSYQKTGTLLHEMLHAIGVGTISTWSNNSFLRSNTTSGYWLGARTTRAVRFWDNSTTSRLNGDATHMWPYGINGAHEDAGTDVLYIGNSVLAEALGEDGLAPTSSQFAIPAYVFEQEDDAKYYLKNEEDGLSSKFLRVDKTGNLQWKAMTAEEATANDSAAWHITFDPITCYYSLQNAATGRYMTYKTSGNNGIKTVEASGELTAMEKFHFLPSPVGVATINGEEKYGYWIANVQNNDVHCLGARSNSSSLYSDAFTFSQNGGTQRWMIVNGQELQEMMNSLKADALEKLNAQIKDYEDLLQVPHVENEAGADATYSSALAQLKENMEDASLEDLADIQTKAGEAMRTFLGQVQATSADQPFDLTFMMQNPGMEATDGWTANNGTSLPSIGYSCAEFYQKNIDLSQKLTQMPVGTYELKVQAFQRPGSTTDVSTAYAAGTSKVNPYIYLNNVIHKQTICNIMQDAQTTKLGVGKEAVAGTKYVPNDMQAASYYFGKHLYENSVKITTTRQATLTIGIKGTNSSNNYWTIFDNFRLYYYGKEIPTAIQEVKVDKPARRSQGVYTISGQFVRSDAENLVGLPSGIYIVNGKKVVVK